MGGGQEGWDITFVGDCEPWRAAGPGRKLTYISLTYIYIYIYIIALRMPAPLSKTLQFFIVSLSKLAIVQHF